MISVKEMIFSSMELVRKTQIKRNTGMQKLIQFELRINDLKNLTSHVSRKKT